jgi:hypothetical protein
MKSADEPPLTDQDRRAIEEIRRQLDRDLGPPWSGPNGRGPGPSSSHDVAATIRRSEPRRPGRGLRLAMGAGAVTLAAAVIGAFVSVADLIGPAARSPVSATRASGAISTAPPDPDLTHAMDVRESSGTGVQTTAESGRRGVPIAQRATSRASAPRESRGGQPHAGRVDAGSPGRGGIEAQHRRWNAAPVTRNRTVAPVGLLQARSAPLTSFQAP